MKKVLLFAISLIVIATPLLFSIKRQPVTNRARLERESKSDADALGMINYFNKINGDPKTGTINLSYYYAAMQQAQNTISARAGSGNTLEWQFMGPDNIGGRTRAILFDKNNPSKVFAAGVSGGLWISNDTGQTWDEWSGSDHLPNMCIVSICQDDSGFIYFGTGEGLYTATDAYNVYDGIFGGGFPGDGVWKSKDDGNTFTQLASTVPSAQYISSAWAAVNRLAANPHSPDSIIAATEGGLMVSDSGGNNKWHLANGTPPIAALDVKYSADGKHVFAGFASHLYVSNNGGQSFTQVTGANGFPSPQPGKPFGRVEVAVSPTNSNFAYAAIAASEQYPSDGSLEYVIQTTNGGNTWSIIGTGTGFVSDYELNGFDPTGSQGNYDLVMAVSPLDSEMVFLGGITLWRYTPVTLWEQISDYSAFEYNNDTHCDMHALVFDPSNSSRLLIGSDGGVTQTLNPYDNTPVGVLYSSLNRRYNVTQFYSMSADSFGYLLGGTQDNGSQLINWKGNLIAFPPYHWVSDTSSNIVVGGDGCCTAIALSNNKAYFCETPNGAGLVRSSNAGTTFAPFFDSPIDTAVGIILTSASVGGQFYTPFSLWENIDSFAYDHAKNRPVQSLFAYGLNSGEVWVTPGALSFGTSPEWFRLQNVTGDVTATTFSRDGKYLYVGTDAGNIYRYSGFDLVFKKNGFAYPYVHDSIAYIWNAVDSGIVLDTSSYTGFTLPTPRTILSIATDPNDTNHIIVTCGNYSGTGVSYVAISHDAEVTNGFTFTPKQGSGINALPYAPVYTSCILRENSLILVGTPIGVWSSSDDGTTWARNNDGLANVTVMSLKELPYYDTYAIYAGTHGRGMWATYTLTGINTVNKPTTINNLTVFPNPLLNTGHIQYTLVKEGNVIINLYDINGKLIKIIADENMIAGPVDIQFNVAGLANGTYIIQVVEGQYRATRKLVVLH